LVSSTSFIELIFLLLPSLIEGVDGLNMLVTIRWYWLFVILSDGSIFFLLLEEENLIFIFFWRFFFLFKAFTPTLFRQLPDHSFPKVDEKDAEIDRADEEHA
jgi:hypothetical protein